MELSTRLGSRLFRVLLYSGAACGLPIPADGSTDPAIDTSTDEWSGSLSSISPLILLVGERNAKQLLRENRSAVSVLSLAFAPLGLISVLTSMIRLCGSPVLRSYLGYEHEARAAAALEVTRANCGGIHAQVVDGHVVRALGADPSTKALGVAALTGTGMGAVSECAKQISHCREYEVERADIGSSGGVADVRWCLRIVGRTVGGEDPSIFAHAIVQVFGAEDEKPVLRLLKDGQWAAKDIPHSDEKGSGIDEAEIGPAPSASKVSRILASKTEDDSSEGGQPQVLVHSVDETEGPRVSFLCTFEGISELSASPLPSRVPAFAIAVLSLLAMLGLQVICLWQLGWFSATWIMTAVGYIGIAMGVSAALYLMRQATDVAAMTLRPASPTHLWTHGLLNVVKNVDSMDTSGCTLLSSKLGELAFEAVWLRDQTTFVGSGAWAVAIFLTLSFVCHYLGLRSSPWWLSVGELLVCLLAALGRSLNKSRQATFEPVADIQLDRRCYSTGVLDVNTSTQRSITDRTDALLDLRVYPLHPTGFQPLAGDKVAWRTAELCCHNMPAVADRVLAVTGMTVTILPSDYAPQQRRIVVSFTGGVLTDQGLAFPNARMVLAFEAFQGDLAVPTPLLVRGIMRQPQWMVDYPCMAKEKTSFLRGIYISALEMLMTWWTFSEERNDMKDMHQNLHGSMLLINTAFFVALTRECSNDGDLMGCIAERHGDLGDDDERHARDLTEYLSAEL